MDAAPVPFDNHLTRVGRSIPDGALQAFGKSDNSSDDDHHTSGESVPWDFSEQLTISFVPDGTSVGSRTSSLYESFKDFLGARQIESTILKAFQTWAIRSNLNFGLKQDSGDPLGIQGETQGDDRFGDIRIAAVPLSADIFAISIPHEELLSGTWSGDLLVNSNATFANVDEFYSVVLHEAGHILGLGHSTDPTSAMHPTNRLLAPSKQDSQDLRAIYGIRNLDVNETATNRNDDFSSATEIDNSGKYKGELPLVVFGDIGSQTDVDYYQVENLENYAGQITVRVLTDNLSLALPKVTIYDANGLVIGSSTRQNHNQAELVLSFDASASSDRYFIVVEGKSPQSRFANGLYAVATTFDDKNTKTEEDIKAIIKGEYAFLEQSDIRKILAGEDFFEDDDQNSDDDPSKAKSIFEDDDIKQRSVFKYSGSISNANDVDFLKLETPAFGQDQAMIIKIKSIDESGFIPKLRILDSNDNSVRWRYLVNGEGELVIQVDQVSQSTEYKIGVSSSDPVLFPTGNYDLEVKFSTSPQKVRTFNSGSLKVGRTRRNQGIYIARNQLFNIGLRVKSLGGNLNSKGVTVWTTLYDDAGNILHRVASRPGEMRTTNSVLLDPGSYHLVTTLSYSADVRDALILKGDVEFSVTGRQVDEPTGPELVDPTKLPFKKCNNGTKYCYPGQITTPDPYVFVNGKPKNKPPIKVNPPKYSDISLWYWKKDKLN